MGKLMYAECVSGVTQQMRDDQKVMIVSDTGIFIITTPANILHYQELNFNVADRKAVRLYQDSSYMSEC
jgi:hypothetical protein